MLLNKFTLSQIIPPNFWNNYFLLIKSFKKLYRLKHTKQICKYKRIKILVLSNVSVLTFALFLATFFLAKYIKKIYKIS